MKSPAAASMHLWDRYDRYFGYRYPVTYFMVKELPRYFHRFVEFAFHDPVYYLKCRFFTRYHVVNSKLKPQYYSPAVVLLYTSFELLMRLDEEDLTEDLKELYIWWKYERTDRDKWQTCYLDDEDIYHLEDAAMLETLVKLKDYMWD